MTLLCEEGVVAIEAVAPAPLPPPRLFLASLLLSLLSAPCRLLMGQVFTGLTETSQYKAAILFGHVNMQPAPGKGTREKAERGGS